MSKSILILANHDLGLYNFRIELIQQFINEGYKVFISVPDGEKISLIEELGAIHIPVRMNRRGINILEDSRLLFHYFAEIRSIKPDVLITYTIKPCVYGGIISRVLKIRLLAAITGLGSGLYRDGIAACILRRLYKLGLANAKTVFFENAENMQYFKTHQLIDFNKSRAVLLPGAGVNIEKFRPDANRSFSDVGKGKFVFIGRIMKEKGIEEFLGAAELVKSEYPQVKFDIVGFYETHTYRVRIDELQSAGVIDSVIRSDDTRTQMKSADCVVLPSYHEGMSNVLLEAASSGIPIITSDIAGCRESVIDGKSGFLCNVGDAVQLSERMIQYLNLTAEARMEMGNLGRELMRNNFDRTLVSKAYHQEIKIALGDNHA